MATEKTQDRLVLLRSHYLAQIKAKEAEVDALRNKLKLIDEVDSDADSIQTPTLGLTDSTLKGKMLTPAVYETIQTIGVGGGVQSAKIIKYMNNHGFEYSGKNFRTVLGQTLTRLMKQGKVIGEHAGPSQPWIWKAK